MVTKAISHASYGFLEYREPKQRACSWGLGCKGAGALPGRRYDAQLSCTGLQYLLASPAEALCALENQNPRTY
jgi:hypothetical protein